MEDSNRECQRELPKIPHAAVQAVRDLPSDCGKGVGRQNSSYLEQSSRRPRPRRDGWIFPPTSAPPTGQCGKRAAEQLDLFVRHGKFTVDAVGDDLICDMQEICNQLVQYAQSQEVEIQSDYKSGQRRYERKIKTLRNVLEQIEEEELVGSSKYESLMKRIWDAEPHPDIVMVDIPGERVVTLFEQDAPNLLAEKNEWRSRLLNIERDVLLAPKYELRQ